MLAMSTQGNRDEKKDVLFLSTKYPHNLMLHIKKILKEEGKDKKWLLENEFLTAFSQHYPDEASELERLRVAVDRGIIRGFYQEKTAALWKQRVHIQKLLLGLVKVMKEYEAVELLESLMFIFDWNLEMKIPRKWEVEEEDRIEVHEMHVSSQKSESISNEGRALEAPKDSYEEKKKSSKYIVVQRKEKEKESNASVMLGGNRKIPQISQTEQKKQKQRAKKPELNRAELQKRRRNGISMAMQRNGMSTNPISEDVVTYKTDFYGQDVKSGLKGKSKEKIIELLKYIVSSILMEDQVSDVEYAKQLREMEFKHESLMSLSVRKEAHRAKRGDSRAQYAMGEFYAEANTKHTDYFEAAKWYSFAARQGNDRAKLELGKLFDSEKLLADVSEEIQLDRRVEAISTKQYGIKYFKELAEKGYPTAQSILGMKYYFGDGVKKDTVKGIKWLKKAAAQGYIEAQRQLGELYEKIDKKEARKWFSMASAAGDSWAKNRLGKL